MEEDYRPTTSMIPTTLQSSRSLYYALNNGSNKDPLTKRGSTSEHVMFQPDIQHFTGLEVIKLLTTTR